MNSAHKASKTAAPLWGRLLGSVADRIHTHAEKVQRRREMDEILSLPPHILRDIGYYG